MLSRREFFRTSGQACLAIACAPLLTEFLPSFTSDKSGIRCINVVNFIRGVEPRFETDLLLPVQKQMELILKHGLPATWLLQFDALVAGPFVPFLKSHIAKNHEVGFWFEMNKMLCDAAGVNWRGRPGYEWDHLPPVAFTIGYTPEERIKLADTAMREFKAIWGKYPKSIASWNLDSLTMAHLSETYGIDAYAVCRDQIATDGFTIWGAPIAGYYPSKVNCWSPALEKRNQISTPVFRMLGQDPVYYYYRGFKLPSGRVITEPDTMEPTWTAGRSPRFIEMFLKMISETPTLKFAYAQLGQENSFPWPDTAEGYPIQMEALAKLRDANVVHVETMGDSGRRFKKAFTMTPTQAQILLTDPHGNTDPAESTIWYQSRFYRANLHIRGDLLFLRDLTVYSDLNPQPYLNKATRVNDVEQRMPAFLDGYHWSKHPGSGQDSDARGLFVLGSQALRLTGTPKVAEHGNTLIVEAPVQGNKILRISFDEKEMSIQVMPRAESALSLVFSWDTSKSTLVWVQPKTVGFRANKFDYNLIMTHGSAGTSLSGWTATEENGLIGLHLAQEA